MVKFGKNKLKLLNKTSKVEKNESKVSSKITKKKPQVQSQALAGKKASVIKELASKSSDLVELKTGVNTATKKQLRFATDNKKPPQPKQKPVEKQKKRQKTQINDTKLLMKLMEKK